jgi:protein-tyrosine phosphatase
MIDLHAHILPGVDDGVRSLEEARELARLELAEGVVAIAATPHVRADYPTSAERMERGVAHLRSDFEAEGISVEILHGGEIAPERLLELSPEELVRFTLGQSGRYLLVEFPYWGWPVYLLPMILSLREAGLTPVLAHPERNDELRLGPERLEPAVAHGALVQITAASIEGRLGKAVRKTAEQLLELDLVHVLASDAHGPQLRAGGLSAGARALGDAGLAYYLTFEVPKAIAAGEVLPRPPGHASTG